jgi:hypothetical protein
MSFVDCSAAAKDSPGFVLDDFFLEMEVLLSILKLLTFVSTYCYFVAILFVQSGLLHMQAIPWRAFFKSKAVLAMIYAHFCGNWGHYTLLSWLPTYFW